MNPRLAARWHELAPLLDAALEAPDDAARRSVYEGVADPELRALLQALLAHEEAHGFLDGDGGAYAARLIGEAPTVPQALGPYRVRGLLGEGGSGSVYLGERELDGSVQRVALKLLRSGVHDAAERERFRRERRILARLQHPHIARLLDGGFSAAGAPWFALEYVDGAPITAWCDARRLDLDARLRLFATVCEAVAYAHRQLIVHRDLKPANLLVDAQGAPHLLDFGIAKLLDPSERGDDTHTQARRLTPAYAAPEQFDGGAVGTATDVYALGVLLHELLCGRRPQRDGDDGVTLPSAAFAADPQREQHAAARASRARALAARLRGDLDTLLLTALAPEPARRYAGADALAADVARYLAQRPLQARRAGAGYRLRKFLRRHRVAAFAALLLALSVVVGVSATLRESARARAAAAVAAQQASRAGAARDFVLALFAGVTPDEARGREVSARELLQRGEARLAETLAQQPALRVELASDLAAGWRQLGDYERAADLLQPLLPLDAGTAARRELGRVRAAQGRYDEAEGLLREALARAGDAARRAEVHLDLAELLSERGRLDDARSEEAAVEAALRAQPAPDRALLARALAGRGGIAFRGGDAAAAEGALREALALRRTLWGEAHTQTAASEHDLAVVLLQRGQADEAIALLRAALDTRRRLLGERHPDLADTLFNLGTALHRRGDRAGARAAIEEAAAMQRATLGATHPALATSLNSLAVLAYEQGDIDAAIARLGEALGVARAAYGPQHATVATLLGNLSGFERVAGRLDAAETHAREAVGSATAALGAGHYLVGVARLGLGSVLLERGRDADALQALDDAATLLARGLGAEHQDTLLAQAAAADALRRLGRLEAAAARMAPTLAAATRAFPPGHPKLGRLQALAARLDAARGDCSGALVRLDAAAPALAAGGAALRADRAWAGAVRAACLQHGGDATAAQAALAQARTEAAALPYVPESLRRALAAAPSRPR